LSLPQARYLILGSLPNPNLDPEYVALAAKHWRDRKHAAKESHRKKTIEKLRKWPTIKTSRKNAARKLKK
jgi:hypothetical protein